MIARFVMCKQFIAVPYLHTPPYAAAESEHRPAKKCSPSLFSILFIFGSDWHLYSLPHSL